MQPLGTKKSRNLSGQKNHATSQDRKIMPYFGPKKSLNLSGLKKIRQPLVEKRNQTINFDKKNHAISHHKKNHTTSRDRKIMQPLGTKKIM